MLTVGGLAGRVRSVGAPAVGARHVSFFFRKDTPMSPSIGTPVVRAMVNTRQLVFAVVYRNVIGTYWLISLRSAGIPSCTLLHYPESPRVYTGVIRPAPRFVVPPDEVRSFDPHSSDTLPRVTHLS